MRWARGAEAARSSAVRPAPSCSVSERAEAAISALREQFIAQSNPVMHGEQADQAQGLHARGYRLPFAWLSTGAQPCLAISAFASAGWALHSSSALSISGATIVASLSITNIGVVSVSLSHVIFSFGVAPE